MIAHNGRSGVLVEKSSTRLRVLRNSIRSNTERGIDLQASTSSGIFGDGVTANDAGDADTGGNDLQNFPVISSARSGGGPMTVEGTLDTQTSGSPYKLEFFSSSSCDSSGNVADVRVFDGGPDGSATTPDGDTLFARQGVFVP